MRFYSKILIATILVSILTAYNSFSQSDTIQIKETFDKINLVDKKGKKQGLWINYGYVRYFFCNQKSYINSIGNYEDDNKIGTWYYYNSNGFMEENQYYYNDSVLYQIKYYDNNQIKSEGKIEIKLTNKYDTILVPDAETGNDVQHIVRYLDIVKKGDWKYYHKDGTAAKKEEIEALDKEEETK